MDHSLPPSIATLSTSASRTEKPNILKHILPLDSRAGHCKEKDMRKDRDAPAVLQCPDLRLWAGPALLEASLPQAPSALPCSSSRRSQLLLRVSWGGTRDVK
eukprot:1151487-Pelagomonas_calceolata.AAC.2